MLASPPVLIFIGAFALILALLHHIAIPFGLKLYKRVKARNKEYREEIARINENNAKEFTGEKTNPCEHERIEAFDSHYEYCENCGEYGSYGSFEKSPWKRK